MLLLTRFCDCQKDEIAENYEESVVEVKNLKNELRKYVSLS